MRHDYYLHCAGQSSRWGVVDVGLKCMHSCSFCYYSFLDNSDDQFKGMRHADFHNRENMLALVDGLKENGFLGFDVTGGEPTLHPHMTEIIQHATDNGLSSRIITLGQYLMRKMNKSDKILLDNLMDAGLTNFLFSMHDIQEEGFKKITGESWAKLSAAMTELDKRDFHYTSNTTVYEENYRRLPQIAEEVLKHNIYLHNFILMNAYYAWSDAGRAAPVQADYHKVYPYLKEAVRILESGGVGVNIRYAPMCAMPGLEKNIVGIVGVRHDPYEWMNTIDHKADPKFLTLEQAKSMGNRIQVRPYRAPPGAEITQPANAPDGLWAMRGNGAKVLPDICSKCKGVSVCDGIDPRYLQEKKPSLVPYTEVRGVVTKYDDGHLEAGHLDKTRLAYRAPFFVKLDPKAKMKPIVAKSFAGYVMPEKPKVSIIITCYNQEAFVRKAIESAQAQTHPCEIIVVDDASTDGSWRIIQGTIGEHKSYQNPINYGQPAYTRNTGIYHALPLVFSVVSNQFESDFFLCLDADDWIEPTFVEECLDTLRKNPHASIAYPGTITHGTTSELWPNGEWKYQNHLYQNQFVYCSMYRREVWEENEGYKANVRGCEDFDFWVRAAVHGFEAVPVQRALFHYRTNNEGIYEQDVKPNFDKKYRQIVLNNYVGYPVSMVKQAKDGKEIIRVID